MHGVAAFCLLLFLDAVDPQSAVKMHGAVVIGIEPNTLVLCTV